MLENVNCPKSLIRNCQGKWKSDHGSISGIASTPKFKHFQRVTLCPCLTSFVYIHQRVHELPCRETDIHRHTHTHTLRSVYAAFYRVDNQEIID